ncbi:hypothetical protein M408DRAFT_26254 [Serendipita vermifera MAFF 305830]|uniref:Uncharacterized protein n=1 Tax=Serendipita vermifera MAFF 305830 TaxID=933852 RepID=A0A0C2X897_SERVB|nr:hypothetical protein M408DRAFT_26254 [Serendipita vermifera MAFF 305830]
MAAAPPVPIQFSMKLSVLVLSTVTGVSAAVVTSTVRWGYCWSYTFAGYSTTYIPIATTTIQDPSVQTLTFTDWVYPLTLDKRTTEEKTTTWETDVCTETLTQGVRSIITEVIPTLTSSTTKYASTTVVTATATCPDWNC